MRIGEFEIKEPLPALREPHVIASLTPWIDAGSVGSLTIERLERYMRADDLGGLVTPGKHFDFTRYRPVVYMEDGARKMRIPNADVRWAAGQGRHDFIFLHMLEPHANAEEYVDSVVEVIAQLGVKRFCRIGAMYDAVPHTRPLLLMGTLNGEPLDGVPGIDGNRRRPYQGPTSIMNLVGDRLSERGVENMMLMCRLPHYVELEADFAGRAKMLEALCEIYAFPSEVRRQPPRHAAVRPRHRRNAAQPASQVARGAPRVRIRPAEFPPRRVPPRAQRSPAPPPFRRRVPRQTHRPQRRRERLVSWRNRPEPADAAPPAPSTDGSSSPALGFAGGVSTFMGIGNFGIFVAPMSEDLGVGNSAFGWALSARLLGFAVSGPLIGRLIDQRGSRVPLAVAGVLFGGSAAAMSLVDAGWQMIGLTLFAGLSGFWGSSTLYLTIPIAKWFIRKRGRAMSLFFPGVPFGIGRRKPLTQLLVDAVGWRASWVVLGAAGGLTIAALSLILIRNRPERHRPSARRRLRPNRLRRQAAAPDGTLMDRPRSDADGNVLARQRRLWACSWPRWEPSASSGSLSCSRSASPPESPPSPSPRKPSRRSPPQWPSALG